MLKDRFTLSFGTGSGYGELPSVPLSPVAIKVTVPRPPTLHHTPHPSPTTQDRWWCTQTPLNVRVRGQEKKNAVSCHRRVCLCFRKKEEMRLTGGEAIIQRLEIRSKIANIAEINAEKAEGNIETAEVVIGSAIWSEDIFGALSRWRSNSKAI